MNLDQILNYVALIAIASPIVSAVIAYAIPKTKNERLKHAETVALQVVKAVEQTGDELTGEDKKNVAKANLTALLKRNGAEIDRLIEWAVHTINTASVDRNGGKNDNQHE